MLLFGFGIFAVLDIKYSKMKYIPLDYVKKEFSEDSTVIIHNQRSYFFERNVSGFYEAERETFFGPLPTTRLFVDTPKGMREVERMPKSLLNKIQARGIISP